MDKHDVEMDKHDAEFGVTCGVCGGVFPGVGPGPSWPHDSTRCASETIPRLREENRRLREALEKIAAPTYGTELWNTHKERAEIYRTHLTNFQTIARAALQERHEG